MQVNTSSRATSIAIEELDDRIAVMPLDRTRRRGRPRACR
jgi:hypothetical protein